MHLSIDHVTRYSFSEPQSRLVQMLRLTPDSHLGQTVIDWRIDVDRDARLKDGRDGYGNVITMLYCEGPLEEISVRVTGEVLVEDRAGVIDPSIETLPHGVFLQHTALTRADPRIEALIEQSGAPLTRLHRLNRLISERLDLDEEPASIELTPADILDEGHGRSADFAHLMIAAVRSAHIPARIVTGYRHLAGSASAPHALVEAWVEKLGWVGFDPVAGRCPDDNYIRVGVGLDFRAAAPFSGTRTGPGEESLEMTVHFGMSQTAREQ